MSDYPNFVKKHLLIEENLLILGEGILSEKKKTKEKNNKTIYYSGLHMMIVQFVILL